MRIVGIVGSMRPKGNTNLLVEKVLEGARTASGGADVVVYRISELSIGPCRSCFDVCARKP
jgi:multimeric flavodoxin WrbA